MQGLSSVTVHARPAGGPAASRGAGPAGGGRPVVARSGRGGVFPAAGGVPDHAELVQGANLLAGQRGEPALAGPAAAGTLLGDPGAEPVAVRAGVGGRGP